MKATVYIVGHQGTGDEQANYPEDSPVDNHKKKMKFATVPRKAPPPQTTNPFLFAFFSPTSSHYSRKAGGNESLFFLIILPSFIISLLAQMDIAAGCYYFLNKFKLF